jgi:hypothetical protein
MIRAAKWCLNQAVITAVRVTTDGIVAGPGLVSRGDRDF